ncbi:MAG: hypothetical protein A3B99_03815 [Candidatus Yanofskybacteria bacterium RIFCSPHIGHO2_02_FULL_44_12b]|uniref:Peptidase S11 D-alanyl-D-alanine carboxypeptidase A N-terminal domain-containing protein n=2 Tax=Candidatus Yanofskyibacteriota TaxID=1752733 RepID=A0A1F8GMS1_9BACT|nr:MAG: hypothetical protein UW79_C0032G0012 [Candidatus Yanofskybacteria bacterium GW2011_GWA2_44_9]OGN04689.1 MAG: hypothetical protein A2659_01025 [Candidatus Yanofskybacteria bacterium RIFCSPHIGHO2_01_FULL_44_24]OGN15647.1 MAG: hypothetical protein A3B99_03815 [Candidatus Yanofskybacteria bacterium RIFCSPHIGHO2_02_FULL_44_12b]OGN26702.1 MAG: hypothetical protein A2925_03900 [Candidatus Yanofskybacteria bacterium RIFCSPLOWO2_01_FULL_44_22]
MKFSLNLIIGALCILLSLNLFFIFSSFGSVNTESGTGINLPDTKAYILPVSQASYIPILDSDIVKPEISAKSAIVYDTRSSRFLFEKNTQQKLPVASLTKILSAVVVLESMNLDDLVIIPKEAIRADGEKQDLYLGESLTVENLLKLMLIQSSNDAAYALAAHSKDQGVDFVSAMNHKAAVLGMKNSFFLDPAGLNDNAYSSVEDLILLIEYSLNYSQIWDISAEKSIIVESSDKKIKHYSVSTNQLLGVLPDILGGKTGYTDGALECLILIIRLPDYPSKIVSIVLGSRDRFGDTQKLVDWTRQAYRWK